MSVLGAGAPVAAQVDSNGAEDDVFDANETESTIDAIRYQLWGIAGVTGALLSSMSGTRTRPVANG